MNAADLRDLILGNEAYENDPKSVEDFMSSIVEARKRKKEHSEKFELENKLEFEKNKIRESETRGSVSVRKGHDRYRVFKNLPAGVVRKSGEEMPSQVSSSSSVCCSKLRGPLQNSLRVASK
ncbi:hypothetical protein AVEN_270685-1 [Araneus ventricosus]|uniref:Uncharacterized protein n=1 Tax=Araneus ventricosus TaxID=182803 RepID=A0A4Y2FV28_ARAVE|nr:hypothetical protein AVEN_270685-1 [Araneus ventricosus]